MKQQLEHVKFNQNIKTNKNKVRREEVDEINVASFNEQENLGPRYWSEISLLWNLTYAPH